MHEACIFAREKHLFLPFFFSLKTVSLEMLHLHAFWCFTLVFRRLFELFPLVLSWVKHLKALDTQEYKKELTFQVPYSWWWILVEKIIHFHILLSSSTPQNQVGSKASKVISKTFYGWFYFILTSINGSMMVRFCYELKINLLFLKFFVAVFCEKQTYILYQNP